jgi:hypothetical protein
MSFLTMYFASDNEAVSQNQSNPVTFTLRADLEETDEVRLYLETDTGFINNDTEIEITGTTGSQWSLALDDNESPGTYGDWGDPLDIGTVEQGTAGRVFFWARARATDDEEPANDTTVTLRATGITGAV